MTDTEQGEFLSRFDDAELVPLVALLARRSAYLRERSFVAFARYTLDLCTRANDAFLHMAGAKTTEEIDGALGTAGMFLIITRLNSALPRDFPYCVCALDIGDSGEYYKYSAMRFDAYPNARSAVRMGFPIVISAPTERAMYGTGKAKRLRDIPPPPLPKN